MLIGKKHAINIIEPVEALDALVKLLKLRRTSKASLKINVTAHMLELSKNVSHPNIDGDCVIAQILRRSFPKATIGYSTSVQSVAEVNFGDMNYIPLPKDISDFIITFDKLSPDARVNMTPIIFYLEIPSEAVPLMNAYGMRNWSDKAIVENIKNLVNEL